MLLSGGVLTGKTGEVKARGDMGCNAVRNGCVAAGRELAIAMGADGTGASAGRLRLAGGIVVMGIRAIDLMTILLYLI